MQKQAVLLKLAQARLAVNYVLRHRALQKNAVYTNKTDFEDYRKTQERVLRGNPGVFERLFNTGLNTWDWLWGVKDSPERPGIRQLFNGTAGYQRPGQH